MAGRADREQARDTRLYHRQGNQEQENRQQQGRAQDVAGPELFKKIFAIVVTDNGPKFSDPVFIEANPLFVPRGEDDGKKWKDCVSPDKYRARVLFCNSFSPKQKAHIEHVHEEVRRVLGKGVSFQSLTQDDVNLAFSHVNSYTRGVLDDATPYDSFVARNGDAGKKFLNALGIRRIEPNDMPQTPAGNRTWMRWVGGTLRQAPAQEGYGGQKPLCSFPETHHCGTKTCIQFFKDLQSLLQLVFILKIVVEQTSFLFLSRKERKEHKERMFFCRSFCTAIHPIDES